MMELHIQKCLDGANSLLKMDLQLSVPRGKMIGIIGKSGEGKSSFMRMLAGLLAPDSGEIYFDNECWFSSEKRVDIPPQGRKVGLVFQEYALFPNFTVLGNLLFAAGKKTKKEAQDLLKRLELTELADKKPQSLSGGQRQRVALARALMYHPQLLLLDEAMAAVDEAMREKVQGLILEYHKRYQPVCIIVSHSYSSLDKMADAVYELENGRLRLVNLSSARGVNLVLLEIKNEKALVKDVSGKISEIPSNWIKGKMPGDRIFLSIGR